MILIRALILALVAAPLGVASLPAFAQTQGQLALPDLGAGVRDTCPTCAAVFNPTWHARNNAEAAPPVGFTFTQNAAITAVDFTEYCSVADGDPAPSTPVITLASGSLPTGLSITASALGGTPTTVQSVTGTLDCDVTSGNSTVEFDFEITGTDTTAPAVPANLALAPSAGNSQTALTFTWDAVTDESGVEYLVRYASTQSDCETGTSTLLETSSDTTAELTGLVANTTRWGKVRARDLSAAANLSVFSACVSGTTNDGSPEEADIFDAPFEAAVGSGIVSPINESSNCNSGDCCTISHQSAGGAGGGSTYIRSTLVPNPPNGGNYRCEMVVSGIGRATFGIDYYYGMKVRVPASNVLDTLSQDLLMQLHTDATNQACHFALAWDMNNTLEWNKNKCASDVGGPTTTLIAPVARDTWYSICVNVRWNTTTAGRVKVWLNASSEGATPLVNFTGKTVDAAQIDANSVVGRLKWGNYKTKWRTNNPPANMAAIGTRIFHHDDVRIASTWAGACG